MYPVLPWKHRECGRVSRVDSIPNYQKLPSAEDRILFVRIISADERGLPQYNTV